MIVRYEPWGAWVRLEREAALVALDRDGVRALGLDGGSAWTRDPRPSAPLEVHLAVTSRCAAGCEGCYLDARPDGVDPPRADLEAAFDALADAGVFTVAFGGGEPTLRGDLGALAEAARARGIVPVVTTSGLGLNEEKRAALRAFAQVNVSYDGSAETYASVRGFDGARQAEAAIRSLAEAGLHVGVNVVLVRDTFDRTLETVRRAHALGAREVQLLRWKPAGRATSLDYLARRLTPEQVGRFPALLRAIAEEHAELRVRIDCALVPFLSGDPELAGAPEALARWGVLGCEAGAALGAARVDGRLAPCSFAAPTEAHVTDLARSWRDGDRVLDAFRRFAAAPPEPCASCTLRAVCRGGCKIVSAHVAPAAEGFAPDPECPRVESHRGRAP